MELALDGGLPVMSVPHDFGRRGGELARTRSPRPGRSAEDLLLPCLSALSDGAGPARSPPRSWLVPMPLSIPARHIQRRTDCGEMSTVGGDLGEDQIGPGGRP